MGCNQRDRDGRFAGFRANIESVPMLPAWAVRQYLDDPRSRPYLLVWNSLDGETEEAVRLAQYVPRIAVCPATPNGGDQADGRE